MEELLLERPCVEHQRQDEWYSTPSHESVTVRVAAREIYRQRRRLRESETLSRRRGSLYWYSRQARIRRHLHMWRPVAVSLPDVFQQLATKWERETRHVSSITRTAMHPAYQSIIGMGEPAVPLILRELSEHGGHWFWALRAITRHDPTPEGGNFEEAVRAWLNWGRSQGYI
jgi:hypothetical protein